MGRRAGIETTVASEGVTAAEFMALMRECAVSNTPRPQMEETVAFLGRCCDLGLLRSEHDQGTTRYFPTQRLAVLDTSD